MIRIGENGSVRSASAPMGRRGVTLVELLMAMVVAMVLMGSIFTVLVSSQRTYGVQGERIAGQQTVRAGIDLLSAELRELSVTQGDLIVMDQARIQIRASRGMAVVCEVIAQSPLEVRGSHRGGVLEEGTPVWVFSEGDPDTASDDLWLEGSIAGSTSADSCPDGRPGIRLTFNNLSPSGGATGVRIGAMVRGFEVVSYQVITLDNEPYLGIVDGSGDRTPLVGPLASGEGVRFDYLDAAGNATTTASQVRSIRATLWTASDLSDDVGRPVSDSLSIRINTRN